MAEGVGGEFGYHQFSKLCLLGEPPRGEGLTAQFASVSERLAGDASIAAALRFHAAAQIAHCKQS